MIYGYARESIHSKAVPLKEQVRSIRWYCRTQGWEFDLGNLYVDIQPDRGQKRVALRAAADTLLRDRVEAGDHLVVCRLGDLFCFANDMVCWLRLLKDHAVELHLADRITSVSRMGANDLIDVMREAKWQSDREWGAIQSANQFGVRRRSKTHWIRDYGKKTWTKVSEEGGKVVRILEKPERQSAGSFAEEARRAAMGRDPQSPSPFGPPGRSPENPG